MKPEFSQASSRKEHKMNSILSAGEKKLFTTYIRISIQDLPAEKQETVFKRMIILEDAQKAFLTDVSAAIKKVHEPFRSAVIRYFGLQGSDQCSLDEISKTNGISRERAQYLVKQGCLKLFDFMFLPTGTLPKFLPGIREEVNNLISEE